MPSSSFSSPAVPPPVPRLTPWQWVQRHLFNTWYNGLLTLLSCWLLYQGLQAAFHWLTSQAQWSVVGQNLRLFLVGRYPLNLAWRPWSLLALVLGLGITSWGVLRWRPHWSGGLPWLWFGTFPVFLWLLGGGWGLTAVPTNLWSGLVLTLLLALVSIGLAFPLGVLLALGRQSSLPVLRWLSILYIEMIRGLPLIGILFLAQVMLPLVLPSGLRLDRVLRAIAGLVIFNSAYLAETVRGGLQAVPGGQREAAIALGLNPPLTLGLIVLPQALTAVIPALVGQFISLFKDTSLLSIFALVELIGVARSVLAQPQFLGRYAEVYLFVGLIYWLFCFALSQASQRLERQFSVEKSS